LLYGIIIDKANKWLLSSRCTVKPIFDHIYRNNNLREAQIQALLVYLYLKLEGGNKPLYELFGSGFFNQTQDLASLNINQQAREYFEKAPCSKALFDLANKPIKDNSNKTVSCLSPQLKEIILKAPGSLEYERISRELFYGVNYADYLFSLPMGAGKTFLMAAIIYFDLYFALNEPDNPLFAHNFLIMVPSGLKSSIIPSLKTIENFDPSWVLPEPSASNIKRMIKFEVLDQSKSAKKSNKARNPNAQKVASYQPFDTLMGLVLVVNAEKVILDRLELKNGLLSKPVRKPRAFKPGDE